MHRSPALRAAAAMGLGGVAFTLGNLILARALSSSEYGLVSLIVGIVSVAGLAAPLGLDLVIARRGLKFDLPWRKAVLTTSLLTGAVTCALAAWAYHPGPALLACILVTTVACGVTQSGAAHFQGQHRFAIAVWIAQFFNWTLLLVACVAAAFGLRSAIGTWVLIANAAIVAALGSWILVIREEPLTGPQAAPKPLLSEALSLVGIHTANAVLLQMERLLLIPTVGVHDLALYGVVAALVGSPFRMLQGAVLFTLMPAMRSSASVRARRRLLRREIPQVAAAIAIGSLFVWFVAPPLAHWFLSGRYVLTDALMLAALASGVLKVMSAFAIGTVTALAHERNLRTLSVASWMGIGISIVAGFAAAPWGLVGVLYGICAGWLFRTLVALWMAIHYLSDPKTADSATDTSAVDRG